VTSRLYIAQMHDYGAFKPFRIIEKVSTLDGPRDRITNESFATLDEAKAFVRAHGGQGEAATVAERAVDAVERRAGIDMAGVGEREP
jgi:hypothetical protein